MQVFILFGELWRKKLPPFFFVPPNQNLSSLTAKVGVEIPAATQPYPQTKMDMSPKHHASVAVWLLQQGAERQMHSTDSTTDAAAPHSSNINSHRMATDLCTEEARAAFAAQKRLHDDCEDFMKTHVLPPIEAAVATLTAAAHHLPPPPSVCTGPCYPAASRSAAVVFAPSPSIFHSGPTTTTDVHPAALSSTSSVKYFDLPTAAARHEAVRQRAHGTNLAGNMLLRTVVTQLDHIRERLGAQRTQISAMAVSMRELADVGDVAARLESRVLPPSGGCRGTV
jgi:hypothetical protein